MIWAKIFSLLFVLLIACGGEESAGDPGKMNQEDEPSAEVLSVAVSGSELNYTFNVEVKSPDTGCDQYADWWEVVSLDTTLLYRRILAHSHVSEQPFKRSGGPVTISKSQQVIVRAHMNNLGYGVHVLKGSIEKGFEQTKIATVFGQALSELKPLPDNCAF